MYRAGTAAVGIAVTSPRVLKLTEAAQSCLCRFSTSVRNTKKEDENIMRTSALVTKLGCSAITLLLAVMVTGCDGKPLITKKIKSHPNKPGDEYCLYTISKPSPGAPLKKDDKICLLCPPPRPEGAVKCSPVDKFTLAGDISYEIANAGGADKVNCDECPPRAGKTQPDSYEEEK
jgi:hypothetical protein